jgi:hypothetical protein
MDALLVGTKQQLKGSPTSYGHCFALRLNDTLEIFEHKRRHLLVITKPCT